MKCKLTEGPLVEIISGNDFMRVDRHPSKLSARATVLDSYYVCPRCLTRLVDAEHLKTVRCDCGLYVRLLGAAMQISDSPIRKKL